jgi:hypothetical protein
VVHALLVVVGGDGGPDTGADEGQCGDQEADGGLDTLEEHRYHLWDDRKIVLVGAGQGERRHSMVNFLRRSYFHPSGRRLHAVTLA